MSTHQTAVGHLPPGAAGALSGWARESGLSLLVLFGSSATGRAGEPGDVDLAILLDPLPDPPRRLQMIGEVQDRLGGRRADVVFLHPGTDPVLRFEIFKGGVPLHEARPGLFVQEVVRALALYEDALPFRRALRDSFRKGKVGT